MNNFYIGCITGFLFTSYILPIGDYFLNWLEIKKEKMQIYAQQKINKDAQNELAPTEPVSAIGFHIDREYEDNEYDQ